MQTFDNPSSKRFGSYRLIARLGAGSMAEVFKAELEGAGGFTKTVALKVYRAELSADPEFAPSFISEARLGGYLHHDNIVASLDFGREEERLFLSMEYVAGPSLKRVIRHLQQSGEPMVPDIALQIISQICQGLDYAHRATDDNGKPLRMVHRDLKPSNILISRAGTVKIADFGVARAESNAERTMVPTLKGTLRYMSPEQARGKATLDHRSDLFAVGLLLFELLTLEQFYQGTRLAQVLEAAKAAQTEQRLSQLPPLPAREAFLGLLRRALAKEPASRFGSAGEMVQIIGRMRQQIGPPVDLRTWLSNHNLVPAPRTKSRQEDKANVTPEVGRTPRPAGKAGPRSRGSTVATPVAQSYSRGGPQREPSAPPSRRGGRPDRDAGPAGPPSISWVETQNIEPPVQGPKGDFPATQHKSQPAEQGRIDPDETRMEPAGPSVFADVRPSPSHPAAGGNSGSDGLRSRPGGDTLRSEPTRSTKDPFLVVVPPEFSGSVQNAGGPVHPQQGGAATTAADPRTGGRHAQATEAGGVVEAEPRAPDQPRRHVSHSEPTRAVPNSDSQIPILEDSEEISEVDLGTVISPPDALDAPPGGDHTRKIRRHEEAMPGTPGSTSKHDPTVVLPRRGAGTPSTAQATTRAHDDGDVFHEPTRRLPRGAPAQPGGQVLPPGTAPHPAPTRAPSPPSKSRTAPVGQPRRSTSRHILRNLIFLAIVGGGLFLGYRNWPAIRQRASQTGQTSSTRPPVTPTPGIGQERANLPKEIPPEQIGLISESTKSAEGEVAFRGLRNEAVRTEIAPLQRSPAAPATAALDPKLIYLMLESHPEARYFLDEKPIQVDKNHPHTVTPGDHAVTFYFRGGHILEARFQANPGQHLLCTADWEAQTAHCGPWSH